jgi:hypothetical protein
VLLLHSSRTLVLVQRTPSSTGFLGLHSSRGVVLADANGNEASNKQLMAEGQDGPNNCCWTCCC